MEFIKYRLIGIAACVVIETLFPYKIWAMDLEAIKSEYMGTSYHYARETGGLFKNSDYVNYESRQLRFFTGKNIFDSWQMEWEFVIANVMEQRDTKKDEMLYDLLRFDQFSFFTGLSAGIGYLSKPSGYNGLADKNPFGLIEGRLGIAYKINRKYFLRAQIGLWHVSSVFGSDQGHNNWDYSLQLGYRF
ncbi:MAG: hypothetical protein PVG39_12990 [Desulfobacteraceae bacterium]|jgi:hypothetical protein